MLKMITDSKFELHPSISINMVPTELRFSMFFLAASQVPGMPMAGNKPLAQTTGFGVAEWFSTVRRGVPWMATFPGLFLSKMAGDVLRKRSHSESFSNF